jgi:hypothetical protein
MKLIKEPKDVDFIIQSAEWSEKDLIDFRNIMLEMKAKKNRKQTQIHRPRVSTL